MHTWQMHEAKARLAELLKDSEREGPQQITVHGRPVAVVLSQAEFERLAGHRESLLAFMQRSPLAQCEELEFERDRSLTRELEL
jgi:prevent-host-death family protein